MGGQVLGGGVIVLVAVLLWLVYLLPSWHSRRQFDAVERNAVRLNQALRVLAETSETPEEVRLELDARTALAQQRLAKRALAEREQAAIEQSRHDLERARDERLLAAERARDERMIARSAPEARRARARRTTRLIATACGVIGLGIASWGAWEVVTTGSQWLMWAGVALAVFAGLVLRRMAQVVARSAVTTVDAPARRNVVIADLALHDETRVWAPRELPRPLTASAGSQAAAVLDAAAEREALRQAALEEAMRAQAEAARPTPIETARPAASQFASMGYVDDAEIEAHVRDLLTRRASGS